MVRLQDGPVSSLFKPLSLHGNMTFATLSAPTLSAEMVAAAEQAPRGDCVGWGIPFSVCDPVVLSDKAVHVTFEPIMARQLVFMHTSDVRPMQPGPGGLISPTRGRGQLGETAADYVIEYADGTEDRVHIRRRHQLGAFTRGWGENCFEAVAQHKPRAIHPSHESGIKEWDWGWMQTHVETSDQSAWTNWLWAWENPHPDQPIAGIRLEPVCGVVVVSALTASQASSQPLRWRTRRKATLILPEGQAFQPTLDAEGQYQQIQLDLGQVISMQPRLLYPNDRWTDTYNNQLPIRAGQEVLIEYTSHPDACFHLQGARAIPVAQVEAGQVAGELAPVAPATQRVTLKTVAKDTGRPVPVKLHVHGQAGEYLPPVDRHRIPNTYWFEDYSADFAHQHTHFCTYIPGETTIDLPLGSVYVEVSKGFEIRPVRKVVQVDADTREVIIELEKVLPWRERGWVTADTHVHFLSPGSALLEGAAEGVNVINLLASQWGELMTNVGDFDGATTWGSRETGGGPQGDGEYLVRVGTENRQHVLGHISLLGYQGHIIAPMTTGGPDESALGDPIEILLTEWARQCKKQGGLVVLPHFPNPRAEHAASIVSGDVDALEMTSWDGLYNGIDPYSLSDWYRYLNCGYMVAAVGGTDKMWAATAVGTVRTYARIAPDQPFTYAAWMDAVRRAETFVTYGPLIDFAVDGKPMGNRIAMTSSGGTVDVTWQASSVTVPLSRVELVVNGEIRESLAVPPDHAAGHWSVRVDKSAWLALLLRGHYADKPEIITAHSSPVMVMLDGSPIMAAADAVTILDQIEGALAYLDTVGTRADDAAYKRMRLVLQSAHRSLHNRMHQLGYYHDHTPVTDHPEHH
ncbi:MAG: CehA/McbA family metallohydrolase [Chloroflexi bacterium]|nr:CehA/McbA family metallohydrolase [Chloroflexota bacterium]